MLYYSYRKFPHFLPVWHLTHTIEEYSRSHLYQFHTGPKHLFSFCQKSFHTSRNKHLIHTTLHFFLRPHCSSQVIWPPLELLLSWPVLFNTTITFTPFSHPTPNISASLSSSTFNSPSKCSVNLSLTLSFSTNILLSYAFILSSLPDVSLLIFCNFFSENLYGNFQSSSYHIFHMHSFLHHAQSS